MGGGEPATKQLYQFFVFCWALHVCDGAGRCLRRVAAPFTFFCHPLSPFPLLNHGDTPFDFPQLQKASHSPVENRRSVQRFHQCTSFDRGSFDFLQKANAKLATLNAKLTAMVGQGPLRGITCACHGQKKVQFEAALTPLALELFPVQRWHFVVSETFGNLMVGWHGAEGCWWFHVGVLRMKPRWATMQLASKKAQCKRQLLPQVWQRPQSYFSPQQPFAGTYIKSEGAAFETFQKNYYR